MARETQAYGVKGNAQSEQAEPSNANRGGGTVQMRILIELQVISHLLREGLGIKEDLAQMRQDVSDSIS